MTIFDRSMLVLRIKSHTLICELNYYIINISAVKDLSGSFHYGLFLFVLKIFAYIFLFIACLVLYVSYQTVEGLSGEGALARGSVDPEAVQDPVILKIKVNPKGVTLTDTKRRYSLLLLNSSSPPRFRPRLMKRLEIFIRGGVGGEGYWLKVHGRPSYLK